MPPWYVEKNIGIQKFQNDPSLSDDEIAKIAKWADSGAPRGNPADMPPPKVYADEHAWAIGTPDLDRQDARTSTVKGDAPDWWGEIPSVPTGLDRRSLRRGARDQGSQRRRHEGGSGRATVGGRFVFHHMIWSTQVLDGKPDQRSDPLGDLHRRAKP